MIQYTDLCLADGRAAASVSAFKPAKGGVAEYNAIIRPLKGRTFSEQWSAVSKAVEELCAKADAVFARVFLSDPANQTPLLEGLPACAVSVVGQSPLYKAPDKVSVWLYLREDAKPELMDGGIWRSRWSGTDLTELWQGSLSRPGETSYEATSEMLSAYARLLMPYGASLERNCLRTWFFVRDVDINYAGMVKGRNEVFAAENLTASGHFIASTGMGGCCGNIRSTVMLDTYAVTGLPSEAVTYLKGASHLNPTAEYGVAFERATAIDLPDRRHVLVSGTASIDNHGEIVCPGDIHGQTMRMCENVEVLLAEAGCSASDMTHAIVYVRDTADAAYVGELIGKRYPGLPFTVVLGPVCRPGWLVEMECSAVR